jgi:membrane-associated protease RseP (regulator of RpoE activity)
MAIINFVWTVANLLPALPLDGGQALRAGLRAGLGRERADRWMRPVSVVTAAAVVGAGIWLKEPVAAVLGAFLLLDNLKSRPVAYH